MKTKKKNTGKGDKRKKLSQHLHHGKQQDETHQAAEETDSELPEEFSMVQGRQQAQQLRKEERESGRRVAAEAKKRRHLRSLKKGVDEAKEDVGESLSIKGTGRLSLESEPQFESGNADEDQQHSQIQLPSAVGLLDDSILQFVHALEQSQSQPSETKRVETSRLKVKRKKASTLKLRNKVGNSVEAWCLENMPFPNEQSGIEFKHDRLFGDRVRRSYSMLQKLSKVVAH